VRVTIVHRFDFGAERSLVGDDLLRPEAWDALRTQTEGPFALPANREGLERAADARPEIRTRMELLASWLDTSGVDSIASYGAGVALPELWLKRLRPELQLTLTDYAPETVERLTALHPDVEVLRHDLLADGPLDVGVHLFHRIDTEFTNRQWRDVLRRFDQARVLVVATEVIDLRRVLAEIRHWPRTRRATRAGWIRTRGAFDGLWAPTHEAEPLHLGDLEGWVLSPRTQRP
jgi:hypothetical protein